MAIKRLLIPKNGDVSIPSFAVQRLMDTGDGKLALLYIYILSCSGEFDDAAAAVRLKLSQEDISSALDILSRLGLMNIKESEALPERADTMPEYTSEDIVKTIKTDELFKNLLEFTQQRLGKLLSTVDTQVLLGIYSWMGLPVDVICLLVSCCIDETVKKYGDGRKPTMRYIENKARLWINLGIMTYEQAEKYLKEQELRGTRSAQLIKLLNLGGRALSASEERYISGWIDMGFGNEEIMKAYDITVIKTGGLKWKYMDTIIKSWNEKGLHTLAQIEAGDKPVKQKRADIYKSNTVESKQQEVESIRRLREINQKRRGENQ